MAKQTQIERAIAKIDADIKAVKDKAHSEVQILEATRARLLAAAKEQPRRRRKATTEAAMSEPVGATVGATR